MPTDGKSPLCSLSKSGQASRFAARHLELRLGGTAAGGPFVSLVPEGKYSVWDEDRLHMLRNNWERH